MGGSGRDPRLLGERAAREPLASREGVESREGSRGQALGCSPGERQHDADAVVSGGLEQRLRQARLPHRVDDPQRSRPPLLDVPREVQGPRQVGVRRDRGVGLTQARRREWRGQMTRVPDLERPVVQAQLDRRGAPVVAVSDGVGHDLADRGQRELRDVSSHHGIPVDANAKVPRHERHGLLDLPQQRALDGASVFGRAADRPRSDDCLRQGTLRVSREQQRPGDVEPVSPNEMELLDDPAGQRIVREAAAGELDEAGDLGSVDGRSRRGRVGAPLEARRLAQPIEEPALVLGAGHRDGSGAAPMERTPEGEVRPVSRGHADDEDPLPGDLDVIERHVHSRIGLLDDLLDETLLGALSQVGTDRGPVVAHPHEHRPAADGGHRRNGLDDSPTVGERLLELHLCGLASGEQRHQIFRHEDG